MVARCGDALFFFFFVFVFFFFLLRDLNLSLSLFGEKRRIESKLLMRRKKKFRKRKKVFAILQHNTANRREREREISEDIYIYTHTHNATMPLSSASSAAAEELKKVREELVKIKRDWESQSKLLSEKNEELSVSMRNGEALERELKRVKVERKREEEERDGWKREEGKMKV